MKKLISSLLFIVTLGLLFGFNKLHSGGQIGTTGSPGEGNCSGCHGGGAAGTTVSISATPSFSNNNYDPAITYTITVTVAHPGLNAFGFDCEVLNAGNTNAGSIANGGSGVQFANSGARKNATHTTPKAGTGSASWTFEWTSPANGNVTFYVAGNAVNSDGGTSGDRASTALLALTSTAGTTGITKNTIHSVSSAVNVFPNPANEITTVSYNLFSAQNISVELMEISGKLIKTFVNEEQEAGPHSNIIDLKGISKGIYFIKTTANGEKISQKLISVQ